MTWELIFRIFMAALLGGVIGLEREYRSKEAGFRTHFLVALGSALFMIVSAYGFADMMGMPEQRWDVSRVAAQVVSGIGFIGAGTIIFHKSENVVRGLTTAAGVWVTAAIGLACGGGLYAISTAATILVLAGLEAFNFILHRLDVRRDNLLKRKAEETACDSDHSNIPDSIRSIYTQAEKAYQDGHMQAAYNKYSEFFIAWDNFLTKHPNWQNESSAGDFTQMYNRAKKHQQQIRAVIIDELKEP